MKSASDGLFPFGLGHGWSSSYGAIQNDLEELVHKNVHSKGGWIGWMMLIPDFFGIFYGENEALIIIEYQVNQFRSAPKHGEAKMLRKAAFFVVAQVGKAWDHTTWIWQKPSADLIGVRTKKPQKNLWFSHPPKMGPSVVLKRAKTVLPVFGMAFDPFNVSSRFIFGKHGYSPPRVTMSP